MRIKKKHIQAMLFYIIILIVSLSIYRIEGPYDEPKVLITNMLIIVLSLIFMIAGDRYNYSLNKIFMLFSFFFFGIAPAIQYQRGITLWTNQSFTSEDYFKMNVLIISILLFYQFMYFLFSKTKNSRIEKRIIELNAKNISYSSRILILISLVSLAITLYVYNYNILNILLRSGRSRISNQTILLLYSNFIRPIPAICLVLFKINNKKSILIESALWVMVLTTNFPTSAARFYIAAIYLPIFIIYFRKTSEKYLLLNKLLIAGILIIFPLLDQARRIRSLSDISLKIDIRMFSQEHFDSYQMFMRVVVENIVTFGNQLVTALLFFVPRSIWEGKSVGSGFLVANQYDFVFFNVSMNYFGEGYINFGYFGIILFIIMIAYFNAKYDKLFWEKLEKNNPFKIFYLQCLGLQIFYLRGDMLSGNAFVIGILVSLMVIYKFSRK